MGNEKLDAAKKRYERATKSELDPDEMGRIALVVVDAAQAAGDLEAARHHAELAIGHYEAASDENHVVQSKRRLAAVLFMLRDWDAVLPLVDSVANAEEERNVELSKSQGIKDPKARAIELARALVTWSSSKNREWVVVWGALMDAFSSEPIAAELERRFTSLLAQKNVEIARRLNVYGFPDAAALAAGGGAKKKPASGAEWAELADARRASGKLAEAYDCYCEAARAYEKTYSRSSNWYADEEIDEDTADRLKGESRFDYKASGAWLDAAKCAFRLRDRAKMDAAYSRELLLRHEGKKRSWILEQADSAAAHRKILDKLAITWGKTSPVYLVAQLDLASTLVSVGYVGEARPIVTEVMKEIAPAPGEDPFGCVSMLAKIDAAKDVELLECVRSARFATAKERLARMKALLASGAKVAATDAAGDGVLHHAARLRSGDSGWLVRALVESGASRDAKNAAGQTPMDVAAANSAEVADAVEALWAKDASSALDVAATNGNLVIVARLLSLGAGPAPAALSRPFPEDAGLVELALRVARKTGTTDLVDAAFGDELPGVDDVRKHMLAFAARAAQDAMKARFGGADRDELIAELVYTIRSDEILETLVKEDWARFAREDLALLRASIPADIDDELGDEEAVAAEIALAFRGAAFDASPPEIRTNARRADFGRDERAGQK